MIDCVATTPMIYGLSFSSQKIRKSFVLGGVIDSGSESCPDVDQIINRFKIDWTRLEGGREYFKRLIPHAIKEVYAKGYIEEEWFKTYGIPIDIDTDSNEWHLKSCADHLS